MVFDDICKAVNIFIESLLRSPSLDRLERRFQYKVLKNMYWEIEMIAKELLMKESKKVITGK